MTPDDLRKEVERKIGAAHDMVHALCKPRGSEGSREWIMRIPAEPDHDPDLVIGAGLRAAEEEIARQDSTIAELKGEVETIRGRTLEEAAKCVPTTWLDPLLDAPVIGEPPYGCPAIETLVKAIAKRIRALASLRKRQEIPHD